MDLYENTNKNLPNVLTRTGRAELNTKNIIQFAMS